MAEQRKRFTLEQHDAILAVIAGRLDSVNRLLMLAEGRARSEEYERDVLLEAAQFLTCSIGALADDASSIGVAGDLYCWHCGPNFADMGKEANHG